MLIIIPCGFEKLSTTEPVPARDLYVGGLFRAIWNKATSWGMQIKILSAGYGLIDPDDRILPYNRKMNNILGTHIAALIEPIPDAFHLCPFVYARTIPFAKPILEPRLSLGRFISAVNALTSGKEQYQPSGSGKALELLEVDGLRQQHRGRNGSCLAIRDALLTQPMDAHDICEMLEQRFGPPLGISYMPTARQQLRVLPRKYNLDLVRIDGKYMLKAK